MKAMDNYLDLCTEVYDLSKPKPPADAYAFYKSYVQHAAGAILEPMCGTGRFLLGLNKDGFKVDGFDASKQMLDALHNKAKTMKINPTVWQGYTQDLSSNERYSLIFIPSGSINLITNSDDILTTLNKFYEHLADNGVFVFEAETKHGLPELGIWRGSKWTRKDGKFILLSTCATLEENICSSIGKYELIDGNRIVQTEVEEYKILIHDPAMLTEMLRKVGFKQIKLVKAFDRMSTPNDNDESIVYECRK